MNRQQIALPVDRYLPEIQTLLEKNQNLVIVAEPGAGKTTRVPPALATQASERILVLEPRRMAAVAAASRIAEEQGWTLGEEIGYQIRFENKTREKTKIVFMTEAILTRQLLRDPMLAGVSIVVLDEFHERSIDVDMAIGLLRELQILGRPIKILVMSATLAAEKISTFLGDCPVINVPGSLFEPIVNYSAHPMSIKVDRDLLEQLPKTVNRALQSSTGDTLVFLPGVSEIFRAKDALEFTIDKNIQIEVLHGNISLEEQKRILRNSEKRRVILTTNIAESSITIDGVDAVVDTGLSKVARFDLKIGVSKLEMVRISQASARQRAGRSSRQKQGYVFRMWSQAEQQHLRLFETPEVLRSSMSQTVLFLSALGVTDPQKFSWFEAPTPAQLQQGIAEVKKLAAIDETGQLTPKGRLMIQWPVTPELASLLAISSQHQLNGTGAQIAALLSEKDPVRQGVTEQHIVDNWECDIQLRLHLLQKGKSNEIDPGLAERVRRASLQLSGDQKKITERPSRDELSRLLLEAFPFRLCVRRGNEARGRMVGGRGVKLSDQSTVVNSKYFLALVISDMAGQKESLVHWASGISEELVKSTLSSQLSSESEIFFDEDRQRYQQVKQLKYLDLVIESSAPTPAPVSEIHGALPRLAAKRLEWLAGQNEEFKRWLDRLRFYFNHLNRELPSEDKWTEILEPAAFGQTSLALMAKSNLVYHVNSILTPDELKQFQKDVPATIVAPTGSRFPIHYPAGGNPFVEIRLQELFGLDQTPLILGQVPLVIHLLGPNYRPVQTTSDLAHFWKSTYFEVKGELKSRYPKHSWPDDPMSARPVAKGKPRK